MFLVADCLNIGCIHVARSGDNGSARPNSRFTKCSSETQQFLDFQWLVPASKFFYSPNWIQYDFFRLFLCYLADHINYNRNPWYLPDWYSLQIGLSFLNCPLEGQQLTIWLVYLHFVLHKAGESHFVNRSDVWLSPFELMSDEVLSQRTRHLSVLT